MQATSTPLRVLVTGANKGIGYGIVETILKNAGEQVGSYHILLSSRDVAAGESAAAEIRSKYPGSKIQVVQLDIANKQSIAALVGRLQQEGGIDVLMNNAGFAFKGPRIDSEVISVTLSINYWGTKNLTEALLAAGLVKPQGKIVVVSSLAGKFRDLSRRNPAVFAQLSQYKKGSLTVEELDAIVRRFESEMEDETKRGSWLGTVYGSSKLYLSIYTYLLSRSPRLLDNHIQAYACCPGWVNTDMTKGSGAPLTAYEGADTPYFLMNVSDKVDLTIQGEFFSKRTVNSLE